MAQYRGGVVGLGWMGLLYDLAGRISDRFDVDDIDRPTPELGHPSRVPPLRESRRRGQSDLILRVPGRQA